MVRFADAQGRDCAVAMPPGMIVFTDLVTHDSHHANSHNVIVAIAKNRIDASTPTVFER